MSGPAQRESQSRAKIFAAMVSINKCGEIGVGRGGGRFRQVSAE